MALFKILKGPSSRIDTATTPYTEGYAYFTPDDGGLYIDADGKRIRVSTPSGGTAILSDSATGMRYALYVENGRLGLQTLGASIGASDFVLFDKSTDVAYRLIVEDGRIVLEEVS